MSSTKGWNPGGGVCCSHEINGLENEYVFLQEGSHQNEQDRPGSKLKLPIAAYFEAAIM